MIEALDNETKRTEMKCRQRSEAELMDSSGDQSEPIDTGRVEGSERKREKRERESSKAGVGRSRRRYTRFVV